MNIKNLNKEININKKFIIIMILFTLITIGLYTSYAYFQVSVIKDNVVVIKTTTINIETSVVGYSNNTFTLSAGESKTITVNLTSNQNRDIGYKMYYIMTSGSNTFTANSSVSFPNSKVEGVMNTSKTITFIFKNTGTSSISIKLGTQGGLKDYSIPLDSGNNELMVKPTSEALKEKVVSYSVASSSDFTGGLVAINTDGTLYNETDSSQEIREYRYSGKNVNNYVFLDTDGDGVKDANEVWRIVGIFKNSDNEWNLKLMRNTVLQTDEIPETYVNKTFRNGDTNEVYWASNRGKNSGYWVYSLVRRFLNDSGGYYGTLSTSIQNIIDSNYTYYLGVYESSPTTVNVYMNERDPSNIYSETIPTFKSPVALLYPSDFGYSASSAYWSEVSLGDYYIQEGESSWMFGLNTDCEWLISPFSVSNGDCVTEWLVVYVGFKSATESSHIRPVINLLSPVALDINHEGTSGDPYVFS